MDPNQVMQMVEDFKERHQEILTLDDQSYCDIVKKIYDKDVKNNTFNITKFSQDMLALHILATDMESDKSMSGWYDEINSHVNASVEKLLQFVPAEDCESPVEELKLFFREYFAADISEVINTETSERVVMHLCVGNSVIDTGIGKTLEDARVDAAKHSLRRIIYDKSFLGKLIAAFDEEEYQSQVDEEISQHLDDYHDYNNYLEERYD